MPEAKPAPAPHSGAVHACGIDVEYICAFEMKRLSVRGEGIVSKLRKSGEPSVVEAYCGANAVCGGEGVRVYDIVWWQCPIEPQ